MKPRVPGDGMRGRDAERELVWTSPYPPIDADGGSLPEQRPSRPHRPGPRTTTVRMQRLILDGLLAQAAPNRSDPQGGPDEPARHR
jgi:hypothetical protein